MVNIAIGLIFGALGYLLKDQSLKFADAKPKENRGMRAVIWAAATAYVLWSVGATGQWALPVTATVGGLVMGIWLRQLCYPLPRDFRRLALVCAQHLAGSRGKGVDLRGLYEDFHEELEATHQRGVSWESVRDFLTTSPINAAQSNAQDCLAWYAGKLTGACPYPNNWLPWDAD